MTTLNETPIGRLFKMGLNDNQIASICGVGSSAVNKWRNGANGASKSRQNKAQGYIDGRLAASTDTLPKGKIESTEREIADTITVIVSVPSGGLKRFAKMMALIDLEWVDIDS